MERERERYRERDRERERRVDGYNNFRMRKPARIRVVRMTMMIIAITTIPFS